MNLIFLLLVVFIDSPSPPSQTYHHEALPATPQAFASEPQHVNRHSALVQQYSPAHYQESASQMAAP